MKQIYLKLFCLTLMFVTGSFCHKAYAYDIAVENEDGVTIYYNYYNEGTELEVTGGKYWGSYRGSVNIPETVIYMNRTRKVTSINKNAFYKCDGLTSVTIPEGVTNIGEEAFYNCTGLTGITIPSSVTNIGVRAFYGCTGLTSVTVLSSMTSIGEMAFNECSGLMKVIVPDIAAWCSISFTDFESNPLLFAKHLYSDESTEITDLVIPEGVTSIGKYAFFRCSGLTSVTIPESVTSIGESAFYECSSPEKVIVHDIAAWCSISFANSYSNPLLLAKHLYSDETTEITNLVIPDGVTNIGKNAFCCCEYMTSVTIPSSVTSIGDYAFYWCRRLTNITIPSTVTSIGDYAFHACFDLTSVTIPEGVTSIGYYAFNQCTGMTSITIPSSVTSIGNRAFYCENLATVVSQIRDPFKISSRSSYEPTFHDNTFMNATLYVPVGTKELYKATEGWKNFVFIEEDASSGISNAHGDDAIEISRYTIGGNRVDAPQPGINLIRYSDGTTKKVIVK